MTPELVQAKIDELRRKGIAIIREPSPFGHMFIGECRIGDKVVATHKLITNSDLAGCVGAPGVHQVTINALDFIEATLGRANVAG